MDRASQKAIALEELYNIFGQWWNQLLSNTRRGGSSEEEEGVAAGQQQKDLGGGWVGCGVASVFKIADHVGLSDHPSGLKLREFRKRGKEREREREADMTGKAKPKKHTAKEIAAKVDAATTNRGGGKAGQVDRSGLDKGGHAKFECPLCKVTAPDVKSMQIHHDAKHPKIPFDEAKINNLHAVHVAESSKPRPGIRGSHKK